MARTHGSRDKEYQARRSALVAKARARLIQPGGSRASLREVCQACGVTMPTLKHYFPDRDELIRSVMAENLAEGAPHLEHIATPRGSFTQSIREALAYTATGFQYGGLGEVHALGLVEGLRHDVLGPAFVDLVLEPSLEALKQRLDTHVERGEMRAVDTRHAAITLLSPMIVALLHQGELGGSDAHPLERDRLIEDIAEGFVRGYAA